MNFHLIIFFNYFFHSEAVEEDENSYYKLDNVTPERLLLFLHLCKNENVLSAMTSWIEGDEDSSYREETVPKFIISLMDKYDFIPEVLKENNENLSWYIENGEEIIEKYKQIKKITIFFNKNNLFYYHYDLKAYLF